MMKPLPPEYRWLLSLDPLPRMVAEALKLYGTTEQPGPANSPVILGWAKELDLVDYYSQDAVPWCGLFMGVVAQRAGKVLPLHLLWALDWLNFGQKVDPPQLGDVLIFRRGGGGHVGLYVGQDQDAYHVLGGNQSDQVDFARIARTRLAGARRPAYAACPATVRCYALNPAGGLSEKEA